jgi:SAM-dependent methyltransferase
MPNPSKTFFYSKVYEYIKKFKFVSVIDIGCGNCQFYPIFKNNYLGIDFDKKKIKYVKKLYPNCKIIYSNFKNIKITNLFDLVLCLEVNSINDEKKIYSSIKIFKKLMKLSNKNGYIMVNFWKNFIYENVIKIENLIRQNNFKIIKKIEYGFFDKNLNNFLWKILHNAYVLILPFIKLKTKKNIFYILQKTDK